MALSLKELKDELKFLNEERSKIDAKIKANEAMINAYAPKRNTAESRRSAAQFDFRAVVREIFTSEGNEPLQMKEIVKRVREKHPELSEQQVKSKIVYAVRPGSNTLVKAEYGKYTFKDLPTVAVEFNPEL